MPSCAKWGPSPRVRASPYSIASRTLAATSATGGMMCSKSLSAPPLGCTIENFSTASRNGSIASTTGLRCSTFWRVTTVLTVKSRPRPARFFTAAWV